MTTANRAFITCPPNEFNPYLRHQAIYPDEYRYGILRAPLEIAVDGGLLLDHFGAA